MRKSTVRAAISWSSLAPPEAGKPQHERNGIEFA
jgi:hypothetical protein